MNFIRMWLNDGAGPNGRVLKPGTVGAAVNQKIAAVIESLSSDAELFPGMPKSWTYPFTLNDADAPTGRPAGPLSWAGLANLFFWIDRRNGLGGLWGPR